MGEKNNKTESTGMYTAGFVLGIIGVVFAFIPGLYFISYILGGLALIFGIVGLTKRVEGYKPLTATILGAVSLVVAIIMTVVWVNIWNTAVNVLDDWSNGVIDVIDGWDYTSDALGKTVEVKIDGYKEVDDNFWGDGAVVVTVKNISDKTLSFSIGIEALDESGDRIDESSVYAENLAPGQSQKLNAFTLSSLDESVLRSATYRVYKASSY